MLLQQKQFDLALHSPLPVAVSQELLFSRHLLVRCAGHCQELE